MRMNRGFADHTIARQGGFTLIELMIVLAIMGILITIAQPNLKKSLIRAREAVLREDLFQMRDAIDQYYADNGKYPSALGDLINPQERARSYLRDIPKDPFTGAADWITVAPEGSEEGGIFDVHSASPLLALDETAYNTW
jgi:general secretion pathway protein G